MQRATGERRPYRRTITPTRILGVMAVAVMFVLPQVASAAQLGSSITARGHRSSAAPLSATLLVDGLQGTIGSTIGPDGALYVTEAALGQVTRIDPSNGDTTMFASGLPLPVIPLGGAMDLAFVDDTLYVLVTLVSADVDGNSVGGIYQMDASGDFTVFADLGTWSTDNPPSTQFDVPSGVQYALQPVADGFLVSDGHHNRVLHVSSDGEITQRIQFRNIVPTGLEVVRGRVFVAQAGPIPHNPEDGKVVSFPLNAPSPRAHRIASGYSLLVDVESGPRGRLFALSQGDSPGDVPPATPAAPDSGRLLLIRRNGSFRVLADEIDLPTSLDFVGRTAFITTLNGEVWTITNV